MTTHPTPRTRDAPLVPGLPLLGNTLDIQGDPLRFLPDVAERYGDIARLKFLGRTAILLRDPDAIRHVLVDNSRAYSIGIQSRLMLKWWQGEGLFVNDGASWLAQRRLMQPSFHRHTISAFGPIIAANVQRLCEAWAGQLERPVAILPEMMRLALDVVAQSLFASLRPEETLAFSRAGSAMVQFYGRWLRSTWLALVPPRVIPWVPAFRKALATLDRIAYGLIAAARRGEPPPAGLLAMLLEARDEETGEGMTDRQIRDEIMTLLFAGHETTASALAWTWYLLAKHPAARAQLEAELDEALGGRTPSVEDVARLPTTRMVIEESLRLYPPAWTTFRLALEEDVIQGYRIPAASRVIISPYVMHRHPAYWPEPERFLPERFTSAQVEARPKFAYLPFGGGPRQCIGSHFAMLEMQLVVANIAQRYRLDLVPGQKETPEVVLTLRPPHTMQMRVTQRRVEG